MLARLCGVGAARAVRGVWCGWGGERAVLGARDGRGGLAKKPATPRPAMRAHVRAGGFLGKGGAQGLFFGRLFWHRNEGSVYTGFGAMGSTRHLGSRVWCTYFLSMVATLRHRHQVRVASPGAIPSLGWRNPCFFQSHCFSPPPPFAHSATPKTTLTPSARGPGRPLRRVQKVEEN